MLFWRQKKVVTEKSFAVSLMHILDLNLVFFYWFHHNSHIEFYYEWNQSVKKTGVVLIKLFLQDYQTLKEPIKSDISTYSIVPLKNS